MVELRIWDNDDSVDIDQEVYTPPNYVLSQNYPNPFNPSTTIQYSIPVVEAPSAVEEATEGTVEGTVEGPVNPSREGMLISVKLSVCDILGRHVVELINEPQRPGVYEIKFNAANLPSGMYVLQMRAGNYTALQKMMLVI